MSEVVRTESINNPISLSGEERTQFFALIGEAIVRLHNDTALTSADRRGLTAIIGALSANVHVSYLLGRIDVLELQVAALQQQAQSRNH